MGRPLLSTRLAEEEAQFHHSQCECAQCLSVRPRPEEEETPISRSPRSLPTQQQRRSSDLMDNFQSANSALEAAFQRLEILRSSLQGLERVRSSDSMNPGHSSLLLSDGGAEGRSTARNDSFPSTVPDRSDDWFGRTLRTIMTEDDIPERISELRRVALTNGEYAIARPLRYTPSTRTSGTSRYSLSSSLGTAARSERLTHSRNSNLRTLDADHNSSESIPMQTPSSLISEVRARTLSLVEARRALAETRGTDRETSSSTSLGRRVASRIERGAQPVDSADEDFSLLGSPHRRRRPVRTAGSASGARSLTITQPIGYHHTATRGSSTIAMAGTGPSTAGTRLLPSPPRWPASDLPGESHRDSTDISDTRSYRIRRRLNLDGEEEITNIPLEALDIASSALSSATLRRAQDSLLETQTRIRNERAALSTPLVRDSAEEEEEGLPSLQTFQYIFEMLSRRGESTTDPPATRPTAVTSASREDGTQTPTSTLDVELQLEDTNNYVNPLPQRLEDMLLSEDTTTPLLIEGIRAPFCR